MTLTPERAELARILDSTDVSEIELIRFFPKDMPMFQSDTENIKKLALYISKSLKKKEFAPHELDSAFQFVTAHLESRLASTEYASLHEKLSLFVERGGRVEIIEKSILSSIGIYREKEEEKSVEKKIVETPMNPEITQEKPVNPEIPLPSSEKNQPIPNLWIPSIDTNKKAITVKNILLTWFVIQPIIGTFIGVIVNIFLDTYFSDIFFLIFSGGGVILGIFLTHKFLRVSIWGAIQIWLICILLCILLVVGIALALCGGGFILYRFQ